MAKHEQMREMEKQEEKEKLLRIAQKDKHLERLKVRERNKQNKRHHSKSVEENETKKEIKKRVEQNMKRNAKIDREKVMKILGKEQYKDMSIKEMKVRREHEVGTETRGA